MSVYFSPNGGNAKALIDLISTAKSTIDVAIYSFTNTDIANELVDAHNRGIVVRVIMDKSETHGAQATIHDTLEQAGIGVLVFSPPKGIMHNKFTVVDGQAVATGSYNYTGRAENDNDENMLVIEDPVLATEYAQRFGVIAGYSAFEVTGTKRLLTRLGRRLVSLFRFKS